MRAITVLSLIFLSLIVSPVFSASSSAGSKSSATASEKGISHSHNGRVHTHILPTSGIKHFHRHSHNGRNHIHPYSAEIGFKHTHNSPQKKLAANSVKHQHGGRWHSHPLPRSGVNHQHRHKHGGRTHIHPLPVNGANHFHSINPHLKTAQNIPPVTKNDDLDKQIALLMKSSTQKPTPTKTPFNKRKYEYLLNPQRKNTAKNLLQKNNQSANVTKSNKARKVNKINKANKKIIKPAIKHSNKRKVTAPKSIVRKNAKAKLKTQPSQKKQVVKTPTRQQQSSSDRQFEIGLRYENGTGVEKNLKQAANWYRRAAEQGNTKAQFNLASLYEHGQGVKRNPQLAIKWYKEAAMKGVASPNKFK